MTLLHLCKVSELDKTYQNVANFRNAESRRSWFLNRRLKSIEWKGKTDVMRQEMTLNVGADVVRECDYVWFTTTEQQDIFYFIDEVTFNTPQSCHLSVTLDVFTTYCLDFELQHSYVERCHVDRWTEGGLPTLEVVDEGFSQFDYVVSTREEIATTSNSFIITASEPLGKVTGATGETGGSGGGSGGEGGGGDVNTFPESKKIYNNYGTWIIPTIGKITAVYGNYSGHTGIDIAWTKGTKIVATRGGTVSKVNLTDPGSDTPNYGKYLIIDHGDGLQSLYGHCDTITVSEGTSVVVGEQIATMGNTGYVISQGGDGTHLHFELRRHGASFDPDPNRKLNINGYVEVE